MPTSASLSTESIPHKSEVTWTRAEIVALFDLPFNDLLYKAHETHRQNFDPNTVQLSTLLSIKTGGCAEDCKYCAQSSHFKTELTASKTMAVEEVRIEAEKAKAAGATRFCMGAGWRDLKDRDIETMSAMIGEVKALGMESCMTLGMLSDDQAQALGDAGLDYYNHNVDTSPEYYKKIITTRTYQDRLNTLGAVRRVGMKVCSGGIIGMGETLDDRAGMLETLANLDPQPESVPINQLVPIPGTPLGDVDALDPFEMVRTVAVARILMPKSHVRLSAGRREMSEETQALCYFAGANSIFYGEKLLTTDNPDLEADRALFDKLGISGEA
jgi:biotin synthase